MGFDAGPPRVVTHGGWSLGWHHLVAKYVDSNDITTWGIYLLMNQIKGWFGAKIMNYRSSGLPWRMNPTPIKIFIWISFPVFCNAFTHFSGASMRPRQLAKNSRVPPTAALGPVKAPRIFREIRDPITALRWWLKVGAHGGSSGVKAIMVTVWRKALCQACFWLFGHTQMLHVWNIY